MSAAVPMIIKRLLRQRRFILINLLGLSVGMAASFLLMLVVVHETSYDRSLPESERCYRVLGKDPAVGDVHAQLPFLLAPTIKSELPDVELALRLAPAPLVREMADERVALKQCWAADPDGVSFFGIEALRGNLAAWQGGRRALLLSESEARRLFGEDDPVGRVLPLKMRDKSYDLVVAAVYKDLPRTLSLRPESLCSMDMGTAYWEDIFAWLPQSPGETWDLPVYTTMLRLKSGADVGEFQRQLVDLATTHGVQNRFAFLLQPVKSMYLDSAALVNNRLAQGNPANLWVFSAIALLILSIATVNYVLMGTAQAMKRVKEVSVRKVVGADRGQIVRLVLAESVTLAFMALPLAFMGVEIGLPWVRQLLQVQLDESILAQPLVVAGVLGLTLVVGLLAGVYLALFLSRFQPLQMLLRQNTLSSRRSLLRKALVLFQITVFVLLIGLSLHVDRQMGFVYDYDLGFAHHDRFALQLNSPALKAQYASLKQEIEGLPGVLFVSGASDLPPSESRATNRFIPRDNPDAKIDVECLGIDQGLVQILDIPLLRGTLPDKKQLSAKVKLGLINEAAVPLFEGADPLGEMLFDTRIVGIVKNFHMHSLKSKIAPMLLTYDAHSLSTLLVQIDPRARDAVFMQMEALWGRRFPGRVLPLTDFDETLSMLYAPEQRFQRLVQFFSVLAIFVAVLGLSGFSQFIAEQRVKEVGVRKVLGASGLQVVGVMVLDMGGVTLLAAALATPLMQWGIGRWLAHFAYRMEVSWMVPLIAALAGGGVVGCTLLVQAIRSARRPLLASLRWE